MNSRLSDAQGREVKRARINEILGTSPISSAIFLPLLSDDDAIVRLWAVDAIVKVRPDDAAPVIAPRIDDHDSMVRADAIEAIGQLRYVPAISALIARVQSDRAPLVRVCAAEALGDLSVSRDDVLSALVNAMEQDRNALVRAYAADSLGRLEAVHFSQRIMDRLRTERNSRARAAMLLALYRLGNPVGLRRLLRMLKRVRRWDMEAAILNMLREIISPQNRSVIERAIWEVAESKPTFIADHQPFTGLLDTEIKS